MFGFQQFLPEVQRHQGCTMKTHTEAHTKNTLAAQFYCSTLCNALIVTINHFLYVTVKRA